MKEEKRDGKDPRKSETQGNFIMDHPNNQFTIRNINQSQGALHNYGQVLAN